MVIIISINKSINQEEVGFGGSLVREAMDLYQVGMRLSQPVGSRVQGQLGPRRQGPVPGAGM